VIGENISFVVIMNLKKERGLSLMSISKKIVTQTFVMLVSVLFLAACSNNANEQQAAETDSQNQAQTSQQQMQQPQSNPQAQLNQQLNQAPDIDLSNAELQQFADAVQSLQGIQQQARQDMLNAIQEEGLDANRYSQIMKSQQNPQSTIEVSDQEMEKFQAASEHIQEIEKDMRSTSMDAIQEEGFTPERFQTVLMAVQNDPELQAKLEQLN
jgi:hypothetical protein